MENPQNHNNLRSSAFITDISAIHTGCNLSDHSPLYFLHIECQSLPRVNSSAYSPSPSRTHARICWSKTTPKDVENYCAWLSQHLNAQTLTVRVRRLRRRKVTLLSVINLHAPFAPGKGSQFWRTVKQFNRVNRSSSLVIDGVSENSSICNSSSHFCLLSDRAVLPHLHSSTHIAPAISLPLPSPSQNNLSHTTPQPTLRNHCTLHTHTNYTTPERERGGGGGGGGGGRRDSITKQFVFPRDCSHTPPASPLSTQH